MAKTKIEWSEYSWNPISGCTPISEGCQNCYAKRMAKRLTGRCGYPAEEPFKVTLHPDKLDEPLHWKKPRRVFVCSMSDLFHEDISFRVIAKIFGIMHTANQHIFMVLTKRPERVKEFIEWFSGPEWRGAWPNEYRHVWLGVTAENQQRADERIPILLQIPAAIRFVSVEPMLGLVDLTKWIMPRTPFAPENAPNSWTDYKWPEWVPEEVRKQIEDFWGTFGRKPKDWAENAIHNDSPPFGIRMGYQDKRSGKTVYGQWVFAWNNIGRLIGDNGEIYYPSIPRTSLFDTTRYYWHGLHWIICGGETGPGARPMHPDWAISLKDQCQDACVPFFFKSWGEWAPVYVSGVKHRDICISADGFYDIADQDYVCFANESDGIQMRKVGKKAAGRYLDDKTWDEMPVYNCD